MNQKNISWSKVAEITLYAKSKYSSIENQNERDLAVMDFVRRYMDGGKFFVYNGRNQFLSDFLSLDEAIQYIEENEPKNELWAIEIDKIA